MRSTVFLAVAVLVAAAGGCGRESADEPVLEAPAADEGPPPGELPQGVTAEQAADGRRLYRLACVMCHGEGAEGTQLGPGLASGEWAQGTGSLDDIVQVVSEGAPATDEYGVPMPPRGDGTLDEAQIRAVSAYVYSLSRARTAPAPDSAAADG
jgi:mono/diheme cytochrome c family protein